MQNLIIERFNTIKNHWQDKQTLTKSIDYSLLNYGKLFRGSLFLKSLKELNIDFNQYIDIACAIEMIQTSTLIHDDLPIMDDALIRRGKPTNHLIFTPGVALLSGDALIADAFYIITNSLISDQEKIMIIRILANYLGSNGICFGQVLDLENNQQNLPIEALNQIIINKTSSFFIAIFEIIAHIASLNQQYLKDLGLKLGMVFQIKDDLNDYLNQNPNKDNGKDIDKSTYPKVVGLKQTIKIYNQLLEEVNQLTLKVFNEQIKNYINEILK